MLSDFQEELIIASIEARIIACEDMLTNENDTFMVKYITPKIKAYKTVLNDINEISKKYKGI